MDLNELTVEVRDRTLKRVGQVTPAFLNMKARTRWCDVGEWTLTLPGAHPMVSKLRQPGSGIIVLGPSGTPDGVMFSGPTRTPHRLRNQVNPDGTFTFSGVTDEAILAASLAFPDPTIADPQASSKSRSNDSRTDTTEALLRQYTAFNVANGALAAGAPSWAPGGRLRGMRSKTILRGSNQDRGKSQSKSPRFQNLLELLQEIVAYDPALGFRMVQIDGLIQFEVLDARDRSKFVRFDVDNGTLASEETATTGATATDIIVAGQGEGKDRLIVRRTDATAAADEVAWGLPIEVFVDQRDTNVLAELQQSGDEKLLENRGGTSAKMIPADDTTMRVGHDWRNGDLVTTTIEGAQPIARVTETVLSVDSAGVTAGAALGDVSGFVAGTREQSKMLSLDQRVSNLERTGGLLPARLGPYLVGNSPSNNADNLDENGSYWVGSGQLNTPDPATNWEIRVTGALLSSGVVSVYQEALRFFDTYTSDRWARVRTAGVWSAWKPMGLRTRNFTPTAAGALALGDGTIGGTYSVSDGVLFGFITCTLGSTSAVNGDILFGLPMPYSGSTREAGTARLTDASSGANHVASVLVNSSNIYIRPLGATTAASGDIFQREFSAASSRPFVWAAGDVIAATFSYPIA